MVQEESYVRAKALCFLVECELSHQSVLRSFDLSFKDSLVVEVRDHICSCSFLNRICTNASEPMSWQVMTRMFQPSCR